MSLEGLGPISARIVHDVSAPPTRREGVWFRTGSRMDMIDDRTYRERFFGGYRGTQVWVRGRIENITLRDPRIPRVRAERT